MKRYNPSEIEPKWQKKWAESDIYAAKDFADKPKYTVLTEFPYPSGVAMHMGHAMTFTGGDIVARHKRAQGLNVLFPMGFDAFGLPAENFAIKNKISPQSAVEKNVAHFRTQLERMGYSIDWNRSFNTTDPEYYKWTQWFFLQFFKKGLAYQDEVAINWCPSCKTGIANEEVIGGRHERCDSIVEKRKMKQWMLRITDYAERLIDGLANVDYPSNVADQQINWVGKSTGAEIKFQIDNRPHFVSTINPVRPDKKFTTRNFVQVYVYNPKNDKYLMIKWKKFPWISCVGGGVDEDEYILEAARREVAEETGYKDLEFKRVLGEYTSEFYAENKDVNRFLNATVVLFELKNDESAITSAEEKSIQEPVWLSEKEARQQAFPSTDETGQGFDWINSTQNLSSSVYRLASNDEVIKIFTTRPDTIFGATFMVLAPEHPLVSKITANEQKAKVEAYIKQSQAKTDIERQENKEKTGVFTGAYAINPANNERIQIWIADYIMMGYGTGAIMAVPAHDERDFEFAKKFNLPIAEVISGGDITESAYIGEGTMNNSSQFDGLPSAEASEKITDWLIEKGVANRKTEYKLRDWVYSRQRYWGEPIPIIHCDKCGAVPVPEEDLPVELPVVEHYEPTDDGKSPLSRIEEWVNTTCPKCGAPAKRETDTMPNWAGSNWYYLRYYDPHNNKVFADPKKLDYWGMVDMYLGGMEHTTLHLLYSRFHHQFLHDQGLVSTPEPYAARRGHGMILAADGTKMSKSKGNVVNPIDTIDAGYGADALRLAVNFLAPYDQTTPWNPEVVAGTYRFLTRVWNLAQEIIKDGANRPADELLRAQHQTIKKVDEGLERLSFNTAIAAQMEYLNALSKDPKQVSRENIEVLLQLLAPFAPHIASELYEQLGNKESIEDAGWPKYDEKYLVSDQITIAIQVNGKLRGEVTVATGATEDEIKKAALVVENVANFISGKEPKKVIYIPNKIINFVV